MDMKIIDGIIVGSFGGAAIYLVQLIHHKLVYCVESNRVHQWLASHTTGAPGEGFRSTRTIASWNNITEDRVRYICSTNKKIYLSTGEKEDLWAVVIPEFPRKDIV
jgi:hypothetical protein